MSMKINGSTGSYSAQPTTAANQESGKTVAQQGIDTQDTFEKSGGTTGIDYGKIKELKNGFGRQVEAFSKMVEALIGRQAGTGQTALWNLLDTMEQGNLKARLEGLEVDAATQAEAAALVAEDGFFGVEQTAQRIVDFAKALSGGDTGKIDTLRQAVEAGFTQAERLWGGTLPEISQKTYSRVQELFDQWAGTEAQAEQATS